MLVASWRLACSALAEARLAGKWPHGATSTDCSGALKLTLRMQGRLQVDERVQDQSQDEAMLRYVAQDEKLLRFE